MSKKRHLALTVGAASIAAWAASKVIAKPIPREQKDILTFDEPIILANRGGLLEAPENTMAAFKHAAAQGVHGFFVNVRLTKDEHIVVFHDEYVNRTMNLSGKVADFTLDELQQANAAYYFTEETDAINPSAHKEDSTKVVTLAQLLEAFPHHLICIEIKDSPDTYEGSLLPSKLWHLIDQLDAMERVIIQSEHVDQIDRFNLYAQDAIAIGGGIHETKKAYSAYTSQFGHFYKPTTDFLCSPKKLSLFPVGSVGFINFLKKLNVSVFFQHDDHTDALTPYIHAGVAGFITDRPSITMQAIQSKVEH
ncbi:MAG TPA: glycerophosphodiester phosphodiesterase family protein [Sporosarcina sp.]|nr:glycerophosphodiester phosphodiesterase family protein [Sporosarcina sp.]